MFSLTMTEVFDLWQVYDKKMVEHIDDDDEEKLRVFPVMMIVWDVDDEIL